LLSRKFFIAFIACSLCVTHVWASCELSRNTDMFYEKLQILSNRSPVLMHRNLAPRDEHLPLVLLSYRPTGATSSVFISAGLHGDEPAAVESVLQFIERVLEQPKQYARFNMDFIPLVNPTGWRDCTRLTAQGLDINRQYHLLKGKEVKILENFLRGKHYDLMIDHHEDPRDHVHAFYTVTYGNEDLSAIHGLVATVKSKGFKLRRFARTEGYFNVGKRLMPVLELRTFMLYARNHYSSRVYQVETPTELSVEQRVLLHNVSNDVLLESLIAPKKTPVRDRR